jgi:hypothetical protein
MAQEIINVGAAIGDVAADPNRTAWQKVNSNFTELYPQVTAATTRVATHDTQRLFRERGPLVEKLIANRTVLDGKPVTQRLSQNIHILNHSEGYIQTPAMIFTGGRITSFYVFATNGTNKAIFAWQRVGNVVTISRCADGTAAWVDVLSYTGIATPDALPNIMCDCGNDRMIYVEYGGTGSGRIWASVDNGQNWGNNSPAFDNDEPLFNADWIKHFHGVVYDSVTDSAVLLMGDSNSESRLLYCDDIDDLFANPSVWKTRWGLDTNVQQVNRNYVLNDNLVDGLPSNQAYRAVSADFTTSNGRRYIVWSMDAAQSGGQFIYAQDITDGPLATKMLLGNQIGANWIVKTLSNGVVVVAANSEASGGAPLIGHDVFLRLYAVRPDLSGVDEISRSRRADFASPVGPAVWWGLTEVYGRLCASTSYAATPDENNILGFVGGAGDLFRQDESLTPDQYQVVVSPVDKRNIIANGRFMVDTAGWTGLTGCTIARDTVNKPTHEVASLRIIPNAGVTLASVSFGFSALQYLHWGGQVVTFRFMYRINGSVGTQNPGFFYNFGNNISSLITLVNTSGEWRELIATTAIPKNAIAFQVWWYATRTGLEAGRELSIADVSMNLGTTINNRGVTP